MITREDYLNALEQIDQYHRQDIEVIEPKTPINEWKHINKCSMRLHHILYSIRNPDRWTYIEDVSRHSFLRQRNAGIVTWTEFVKLRGY